MSLILNIETATEVCSASITKDGETISLKENTEGLLHAKLLGVFIEELFAELNLNAKNLDAVAVSMGPGSYTGLRIGVSTAKGIAYAAGIPMIAINTLETLAFAAKKKHRLIIKDTDFIAPMIDARRMEVFTSLFDANLNIINETSALIIENESFKNHLEQNYVYFFGNGAAKCQEMIKSPNAKFLGDVLCSAKNMETLSFQYNQRKKFVDIAYFEPFYLKDFIATIPKKNIFH